MSERNQGRHHLRGEGLEMDRASTLAARSRSARVAFGPASMPATAAMVAIGFAFALVTGFGCGGDAPKPAPSLDPATERTLAQGKTVGFVSEEGAHVWRGLPFAEPPVGDLRFRAPRPPAPWTGTREAIDFGAPCVQFAGFSADDRGLEPEDAFGDEDCLYLNVYAPPFAKGAVPTGDARLPVMVWIHGGGNTLGDAHIYDGGLLAMNQQAIVVTIHYRLGVFGWFLHPALGSDGASPDDASGNYGTLDTVQALVWVQDHISAFGGDPNRVTIFGESAGGSDVFALLATPNAKGLFHRAIAQSGSAMTADADEAVAYVDDETPGHARSSSEVLVALMEADGSADSREAAKLRVAGMSGKDIAAYLRGRSAAEFLALYDGASMGGMYRTPTLIADGRVLPKGPMVEAFARGDYNAVPAIFGTNRDENKLFQAMGSPHIARVGPMPLWFKNERMYDLNSEYGAKLWKARGVDEPARAIARGGRSPVYTYRFDWDEEGSFLWIDFSRLLGAAHAFEIPFVFGRLRLPAGSDTIFPSESQAGALALSEQIQGYWGRFAHDGTPMGSGGVKAFAWPAVTADDERFIVFDSAADGGLTTSDATLSRESVLASLAADSRVENVAERCEIYGNLTAFGRAMTHAQYAALEQGACAEVPLPGAE